MLMPDPTVVLSEIKRTQAEKKITSFLKFLVKELVEYSIVCDCEVTDKEKVYILDNIQKYILDIPLTQIELMEQGIVNPPVYLGSIESPVVVINSLMNRCMSDWHIHKG